MSTLFRHAVRNISNPKRDTTTVELDSIDIDGEDTALPLKDLIVKLENALASIPEEHRENAVLRIKVYGDYSSAYANVEFTRPETDDEMADRKRWLAGLNDESEARDRREFDRLKKKYGDA